MSVHFVDRTNNALHASSVPTHPLSAIMWAMGQFHLSFAPVLDKALIQTITVGDYPDGGFNIYIYATYEGTERIYNGVVLSGGPDQPDIDTPNFRYLSDKMVELQKNVNDLISDIDDKVASAVSTEMVGTKYATASDLEDLEVRIEKEDYVTRADLDDYVETADLSRAIRDVFRDGDLTIALSVE